MNLLKSTPSSKLTIESTNSSVSEFYNDKTVFITGCTGFVGKVLLEKLLRSCPGLGRIYVLIRSKEKQNIHQRLHILLSSPLFNELKKTTPDVFSKVLPIEGDIAQPNLAISMKDRHTLECSVNIVFHSAATVRFNEKLKSSARINLLGTKTLVALCKRMNNLLALVHVSTAYAFCDHMEVAEIIYPLPNGVDQVTSLIDCLDEDFLESIVPKLVGNRPNTYTYTKALTEAWLKENKENLPLVIVRPSIVVGILDKPLKGWVDNFNGPVMPLVAIYKGLLHSLFIDANKIADLIPVDMVVNLMIVSAWDIARNKQQTEEFLPIYNCTSSSRNAITWKLFLNTFVKCAREYPISQDSWYPYISMSNNPLTNIFYMYILQWLPAYIMDVFTRMYGSKPSLMQWTDKISRKLVFMEHFMLNGWHFHDEHVQLLNKSLTEGDRKEFYFNVETIDWEKFIRNYTIGLRQLVLDTFGK